MRLYGAQSQNLRIKNRREAVVIRQRNHATSSLRNFLAGVRTNILTCAAISFKVLRETHIERVKFVMSPEVQFFKKDSEYDKVMRVISHNEEKLSERLNVSVRLPGVIGVHCAVNVAELFNVIAPT